MTSCGGKERMQNNKQVQPQPPAQTYDDGDYDGAGTYGEEEQEFLRLQLDVNSTMEEFEHRVLRGQYMLTDTKTGEKRWEKFDKTAEPIINEIGIREIMGRLLGYGNIITKLSYYEDEEIYKNMFYFHMSLVELVSKRSDYWQLDIETAKAICDSAIELIQSILFSARDGFTAINLKTQYMKQDITRSEPQQSSKKTFLGIPVGR